LDEELLARINEALELREGRVTDPSGVNHVGAADGYDEEGEVAPRRARPRISIAGQDDDGRPQSALTPREIQARLRSGFSIAQVAAEAGVGQDWVARFAAPILAEQQQVLERSQS